MMCVRSHNGCLSISDRIVLIVIRLPTPVCIPSSSFTASSLPSALECVRVSRWRRLWSTCTFVQTAWPRFEDHEISTGLKVPACATTFTPLHVPCCIVPLQPLGRAGPGFLPLGPSHEHRCGALFRFGCILFLPCVLEAEPYSRGTLLEESGKAVS